MSDESFTHDDEQFDAAPAPSGDGVSEVEAKYADLVAEVIWDGVMTDDKRQRLDTAAEMFGLHKERVAKIEASLMAAQKVSIVNESKGDGDGTMTPLAASDDPTIKALQGRITVVEERNLELEREASRLEDLNEGLEELVSQLQGALESTLNELDDVHARLAGDEPAAAEAVDDAPASSVQAVPGDDIPPARESSEQMVGAPLPPDDMSVVPPSAPWKPAPSAPGRDAAYSEPEVDFGPDDAPAAAGLAPASDGSMSEAPPGVDTSPGHAAPKEKRYRSRRVLRESADAAPMVAMKRKRENPAEIHSLFRNDPKDVELLHQLFNALQRAEDLDRRWCIANTLVYLGESKDAEREVYLEYTHAGLVKPSRAVNDDEWHELLSHPDEDQLTGEILACISSAALLGQMTALRASLAPEVVDSKYKVDTKTSTVQAVRCIDWAAAFLGIRTPQMYADPDYAGMVDIVLNPKPSTRLGKEALAGRTAKELAFVAGRHLTWYRREHLLGRPSRSVRLLEDMFLAALLIGNPGFPMAKDIRTRVEPLVDVIRPLVEPSAVERLQQCFQEFVELGGRTNLNLWFKGVERTSSCTGLLLANDLHSAKAMLEVEAELDPDNPFADPVDVAMDELAVFFTAGRCSLLRKRIGIAVPAA